jgi:dodecin
VSFAGLDRGMIVRHEVGGSRLGSTLTGVRHHDGDVREHQSSRHQDPTHRSGRDHGQHEADRADPHRQEVPRLSPVYLSAVAGPRRGDTHGRFLVLGHWLVFSFASTVRRWGASAMMGRPTFQEVTTVSNRTYRVTEVVGTSTEGVDDAIRNAVRRASRTLRHLDWFEVTQVRGHVVDDEIEHFQVGLKLGFRLEDDE